MDWKSALKRAGKTLKKIFATPGYLEAALSEAARTNNLKKAAALLAEGASPSKTSYRSDNALNIAVENGNGDMVALLLKAGASPNTAVSYSSTTPFINAVRKGDVGIISALVDAKANIDANDGNSVLVYAVAARNKPVIQLLLDKGAKADVPARNGWTPLFYAARNGDIETIDLLLAKGARTDRRDDDDRSVLDVAKAYERHAAFDHLQAHMDAQVPQWQARDDGQLAHVSILRAQGYRLTEVFNFETKQCTVISHNFDTGRDTLSTKSFAELGEETVNAAAAHLQPVPTPQVQP